MLNEILAHKRAEVARLRKERPLDWRPVPVSGAGNPPAAPAPRQDARSFREALKRNDGRVALIAEFKRMSPSGGRMRADGMGPREVAAIYERAGAAAISVLTDSRFFGGSLEDLTEARSAVTLPVLRKDFIIDPYQIAESARAGADAVLLIAACLSDFELAEFIRIASGHGMDALVEAHDENDLERALAAGASIIGINNRDLRTLRTDIQTTARLAARIPPQVRNGIVLVSESGLRSPADVRMVAEAGVDAVLIGEAFLKAPDIAAEVAKIASSRAERRQSNV
ncbi:MAG: indole-3-glycerol phosphate synthase TrpC [Planctomycetota bacterium]|nr:indole-3-glycerol phosphate synthase TrpC [Planctomycetota bacterium]